MNFVLSLCLHIHLMYTISLPDDIPQSVVLNIDNKKANLVLTDIKLNFEVSE